MCKLSLPSQGLRRSNSQAILLLEDGTVLKEKLRSFRNFSRRNRIQHRNVRLSGDFTDPSYHRQMLVMATAHIGNYGVHNAEMESDELRLLEL